jgi:hypothetical protein
MKLFTITSITILLSVLLLVGLSYSETGSSSLYAGLPSSPLDSEDSGDDLEEDSGPEQSDSRGSGKSDEAPRSDGNERYEDWYESEQAYE